MKFRAATKTGSRERIALDNQRIQVSASVAFQAPYLEMVGEFQQQTGIQVITREDRFGQSADSSKRISSFSSAIFRNGR
jgi:ABC-type molybdate transport system substrate-binding protein